MNTKQEVLESIHRLTALAASQDQMLEYQQIKNEVSKLQLKSLDNIITTFRKRKFLL